MSSLIFKVCPLLDTPSDTATRLRARFSFMVLWCHLQYVMKRSRMTWKGFLKEDAYKDIPSMTGMPYRASESVWEPIARDNTSASIGFS